MTPITVFLLHDRVAAVGGSLGQSAVIALLAEPSTADRVAGLVLVEAVPFPRPGSGMRRIDDRGLFARNAELAEDILGSGPELLVMVPTLDMPHPARTRRPVPQAARGVRQDAHEEPWYESFPPLRPTAR
jgi:pimeloyl-ACP methyl ester carboxylesterase